MSSLPPSGVAKVKRRRRGDKCHRQKAVLTEKWCAQKLATPLRPPGGYGSTFTFLFWKINLYPIITISHWPSCLRHWLGSLVYVRARGPSSRSRHGAHYRVFSQYRPSDIGCTTSTWIQPAPRPNIPMYLTSIHTIRLSCTVRSQYTTRQTKQSE